jgi:predicted RNA-binding Zn-ribbon protein involved in translation (DUF1610 family)
MMTERYTPCPQCGSNDVFRTEPMGAGGGHAPNLLPGLGKWYAAAKMAVVLCRSCGLIRLFASEEARRNLRSDRKKWRQA